MTSEQRSPMENLRADADALKAFANKIPRQDVPIHKQCPFCKLPNGGHFTHCIKAAEEKMPKFPDPAMSLAQCPVCGSYQNAETGSDAEPYCDAHWEGVLHERARIVAWLRDENSSAWKHYENAESNFDVWDMEALCGAIEKGEHHG